MVTDFSGRKGENLDFGAKHFPGKTPLTGCHNFYRNISDRN